MTSFIQTLFTLFFATTTVVFLCAWIVVSIRKMKDEATINRLRSQLRKSQFPDQTKTNGHAY